MVLCSRRVVVRPKVGNISVHFAEQREVREQMARRKYGYHGPAVAPGDATHLLAWRRVKCLWLETRHSRQPLFRFSNVHFFVQC